MQKHHCQRQLQAEEATAQGLEIFQVVQRRFQEEVVRNEETVHENEAEAEAQAEEGLLAELKGVGRSASSAQTAEDRQIRGEGWARASPSPSLLLHLADTQPCKYLL